MSAHGARPVYPFTAIVGETQMRLALLLHAVNPALGGVLVRGRKGTAKSTAVRALAALLPEIARVAGCPFGCDPADTAAACDGCAPRITAGETLPAERARVPVVELPIGATEDRVVGSLDLERAIQRGERRFEPGLLARANRGILYMDEVNLLGDHLVDLLLDAAAMGRNYVEREGVSVSHPARLMLVGTMNPEEGELRPQLLDRFALAVEVEGLSDPAQRAAAVRHRIAFEADPAAFVATQAAAEADERERLARARALLPCVGVPAAMLDLITYLCVAFAADGLRADLAMYRAAVALAAYRGRTVVAEEDVRAVAPLVLTHRRRRQPFEQPGLDPDRLDEEIAAQRARAEADGGESGDAGQSSPTEDDGTPRPSRNEVEPAGAPSRGPSAAGAAGAAADTAGAASTNERAPTDPAERWSAPAKAPASLTLPAGARARAEGIGKRLAAAQGRRGAAVRTAAPLGRVHELALAATLAAAAPHQRRRRATSAGGPVVLLRPTDLRERVRRGRTGNLVLFVVDASGSMGARERMAETKASVLALLFDAYRRRDQVGMVTFRGAGDGAALALPPTNSVDLAEQRLTALATGGRTPLAAGLALGHTTIERALRGGRPLAPLLVLVSDGRANSAPPGVDPWQAAREAALGIRAQGWRSVVLDTEQGRSGVGLAKRVAGWLGAECMRLDGHTPVSSRAQAVD